MGGAGLEILTVSQCAAADAGAGALGVPVEALMENAGRQVANEIVLRWPVREVHVLCGPGNNGGDGYVTARHLAARGYAVTVFAPAGLPAVGSDAGLMAARWPGTTVTDLPPATAVPGLVVDALFGAGLSRSLAPGIDAYFQSLQLAGIPVVAVDVPSGLHGDTARFVAGTTPWRATLTVTFFRPKPAHVLFPGRACCGDIVVKPIGMPEQLAEAGSACTVNTRPVIDLRPAPDGHKYDRGHCVVVSGPAHATGAARLAARAALRSGAGLVTVVGDAAAVPVLSASLTSVMVRVAEGAGGLASLLADRRIKAVVIGPGCGTGQDTRDRVRAVLASGTPAVIDADGLSAFAGEPGALFALLGPRCILTPHTGEFERLFPGLLGGSTNRIEAARVAARLAGCIVVLKGADSVIAAPDGQAVVNTGAPADLATAGSGDVLAGIMGGLLAQGVAPRAAAAAAVYWHGACGRIAGAGLLAEDLPDVLPMAMKS